MNADEFVNAVTTHVFEGAVADTETNLAEEPGRRNLGPDRFALSEWFNGLKSADRSKVLEVVAMAADYTTFGFFCILDGVRNIGQGEEITLVFENADKISAGDLHERYREVVAPAGKQYPDGK